MWNVTLRYVINSDLFTKFLCWENGVLHLLEWYFYYFGKTVHLRILHIKFLAPLSGS